MQQLSTVTLTGVDEFTSVDALESLADQYPFVEWGLPYRSNSANACGRAAGWNFARQFAAHMRTVSSRCG